MTLLSNKAAEDLIVDALEHLADYPIRTAEGFRNAVFDGYFAANPLFGFTREEQVTPILNGIRGAVREGRMIDFGFLPNDVIKQTADRSREMFEAGELTHPYKHWLGIAAWEGGMNGYLIGTSPDGIAPLITCIEIYGVALPGRHPVILVYDIVGIDPSPGETRIRCAPFYGVGGKLNKGTELEKRGANSLDPVVTFLRLLNDASIPVIDHIPNQRLNAARAKAGKDPIPPHHVVETQDYVSMLQTHKHAKPAAKGGHHASPRSHWRRAHKRTLASGRTVTVRSSRVNWREPGELHRLFYRIPVS
jgi:hypothetical protein